MDVLITPTFAILMVLAALGWLLFWFASTEARNLGNAYDELLLTESTEKDRLRLALEKSQDQNAPLENDARHHQARAQNAIEQARHWKEQHGQEFERRRTLARSGRALRMDLERVTGEFAAAHSRGEQWKCDLATAQDTLAQCKRHCDALELGNQNLFNDRAQAEEQVKTLTIEVEKANERALFLSGSEDDCRRDLHRTEALLLDRNQEIERLTGSLTLARVVSQNAEAGLMEIKRALLGAQSGCEKANKDEARAEGEVIALRQELAQVRTQLEQTDREYKVASRSQEALHQQLSDSQLEARDWAAKCTRLERQVQDVLAKQRTAAAYLTGKPLHGFAKIMPGGVRPVHPLPCADTAAPASSDKLVARVCDVEANGWHEMLE